jgi:general secretion pathway protein K
VTDKAQGASQDAGRPTSGDYGADAFVSGRIIDAQARFNLANLANNDKVDRPAFETLERLLVVTGQPQEAAKRFAARMLQAPRPISYDALSAELVRDGKLDRATADALWPYVVVLPKATPVNLNTASPEVIAASFEDLSLDQARALAQSRDRIYFNQVSDIFNRLAATTGSTSRTQTNVNVAVATHYFEVSGEVRNNRAEYFLSALIERDNGGLTRVVSISEP